MYEYIYIRFRILESEPARPSYMGNTLGEDYKRAQSLPMQLFCEMH